MSSLREKIAGLLAKAERTDNEHERDAFTAKAEELMLKYGIEQAELESLGKVNPEDIIEIKMEFTTQHDAILGGFALKICNALGSLFVLQSRGRKNRQIFIHIIGHKSDVHAAEALLYSLYNQATSAVARWSRVMLKEDYNYKWADSKVRWRARRQFVVSFGDGAAARIRSERAVQEGEASVGASLVLVSKQERVNDWVNSTYKLKKSKSHGIYGSHMGAAAGREAGYNSNVGTTGIGGRKGELS
jgi:hypothetical protein